MTEEHRLECGTGEVVVVREGGRIAELRPAPDLPNLLWRGDALLPLTGGDRLWLAPESDLFYPPDDKRREAWRCPEELDPGTWTMEKSAGEVVVSQHALGTVMTRRMKGLTEAPVPCDLPWTGVRVTEDVATDQPLSGWHLTMSPSPSSIFVRDARDPLDHFGPVQTPADGWLRATADGPEWKMGFPPPRDGRVVLAALGDADPGPLVALIAETDPDGTYVDVRARDGARATALQVYNGPDYGFCEIEHHYPLETRAGTTVLFGAWGERSARVDLLERLAS